MRAPHQFSLLVALVAAFLFVAALTIVHAHDCQEPDCVGQHGHEEVPCFVLPECQGADCPAPRRCTPEEERARAGKQVDNAEKEDAALLGMLLALEIYVPVAALGLAAGTLGNAGAIRGFLMITLWAAAGFFFARQGYADDSSLATPLSLCSAGAALLCPKAYRGYALLPGSAVIGAACGLLFDLYYSLPWLSRYELLAVGAAAVAAYGAGAGLSLVLDKQGRSWPEIAIRILGSWLVAAALMLLALALREVPAHGI